MGCALVDLATNRVINIIVADPSYTAPPGQQAVFYPDGNWADWIWTQSGGFVFEPAPAPVAEPEPVAPTPVDPPVDVPVEPTPVDAPIPVVDQIPIDPAITESSSSTGG